MNPTTLSPLSPEASDIILNDWLEQQADKLTELITPFRATRSRGHQALLLLLEDPETAPTFFSQINYLSSFLTRLHPLYLDAHATAARWQQQYEQASPSEQPALRVLHDPRPAARLLDALQLLNNEAVGDLNQLARWAPDYFRFDLPPKIA